MRALIATVLAVTGACLLLVVRAQAHPSWGIAVDPQGQVYFSDLKTIWKIDSRGRLAVFRAGGDRHTHDLNVDEAGNLYGADNSYEPATKRFTSALWKMTPGGDFSYLLTPTDNPPEGASIWRDRDGNTYHVTDFPEHELLVLKRSPGGDLTALVGSSSAVGIYRQGVPYSIGGMAFGSDGALYFTHGANVSKVTMSGALTPLIRNLLVEKDEGKPKDAGSPTQLFGIIVDAQGNALVADYGNRRVLKITPGGQATTLLRAEEPWFPTGVAARGGDVYILEIAHTPSYKPTGTRVRKLSPDGSVRVLATVDENSKSREENVTPSAGEGSPGGNHEGRSKFRQGLLYMMLGAGVGIFALTMIAWRARKRMSERQHRESLKQ
jgi:sugar lactone lactonase YvrE